ncbi:hypothetical protein L248_1519 [Schleiferilactobacillus shenzhenensis LY-73]|uniref:Uncharacterized protein n=1 Tax=Schleiferilactobacillus shenzhenensis LY-73 TaxID=1231336 RepID=U4TQH1_9LACO|nr:hypothetical protein L248_1519 [Schleiferilactobacillus shenzhenensis LY-73]
MPGQVAGASAVILTLIVIFIRLLIWSETKKPPSYREQRCNEHVVAFLIT